MSKQTLIVGGGIAGLSIAWQLEKQQHPYLILDAGSNHSSRVAAGIINPVVFRRLALSWRVDEFLPSAIEFYTELEKHLQLSFFHPIPIRRAFAHQQEVDLWKEKENQSSHLSYLGKIATGGQEPDYMKHPYGTGIVKKSFWVDTKLLLDAWQKKLQGEQKLIRHSFEYGNLDLKKSLYQAKDLHLEYDTIIFCEGYQGLNNPFFNYLPLQATKGELLTVKNEYLPENESLNYKCFVLPIGNKTFKVGATYTWNSPNTEVTAEAKNELESNLNKLICSKYTVLDQEAGVRPTVLDRRPLLGKHPIHTNLHIYNGLGAKGYLITPFLSEEFIAYLFGKNELSREVSIERYAHLFPRKTL